MLRYDTVVGLNLNDYLMKLKNDQCCLFLCHRPTLVMYLYNNTVSVTTALSYKLTENVKYG